MLKGDKFTFDCEGNIGIKDFTVTSVWNCEKAVGSNVVYAEDKDLIEYSFLERDNVVHRFLKCLNEEDRDLMLHREFIKNKAKNELIK